MGKTIKKIVANISTLIVIVFCVCIVACSNSHKTGTMAVQNFLDWYDKNFQRIDSIDFVASTSADSIYRVDFVQVQRYLAILHESGLFSEKFFNDKAAFFINADSNFVAIRQTDDPAIGFESDLLLCSQEPEYLLENKQKMVLREVQQIASITVTSNLNNDILTFTINTSSGLIDAIKRP